MESNETSEFENIVLPVTMPGDLAGDLVGEFKSKIGNPVLINASQVQRIDTACVEVLVAASKQWDKDDCKLQFDQVSAEFEAALQNVGMQTSMIERGEF